MIEPNHSLIHGIQAAAIEKDVNVSQLLRKAKLAAVKLNQPDFVEWLDNEIDGYDCTFEELPDYRKTRGIMKARNPYHGLVTMHFESEELENLITQAPTFQGVSSLQAIVEKSDKSDTLTYQLSGAQKSHLMDAFKTTMEPVLIIATSQLEAILARVTSMVLDWSLELEKAGILGEGLTFTMNEQEKAAPISQNFFGSNIGSVGSISGNAKVQNNQEINLTEITDAKLTEFLVEARKAQSLLPEDIRVDVETQLAELESSNDMESRDQSFFLSNRSLRVHLAVSPLKEY